jgi:hypothetical protein
MYETELKTLREFKDHFQEFVQLGGVPLQDDDYWLGLQQPPENPLQLQELREAINLTISRVGHYLRACGVATTIHYSPPPMVGGLAGQIDLFSNLFNLQSYGVGPQWILDMVDRGIGTYVHLQEQHRRKRWNPLWWIGELIRAPFKIMTWAGFNGRQAEASVFGKVYKAVAGFFALAVSVIKVWEFVWPKVRMLLGK